MKLYVANAPLTVDIDGERRILRSGELVPPGVANSWPVNGIIRAVENRRMLEIDTELVDRIRGEHEELYGDGQKPVRQPRVKGGEAK